MKSLFLLDKKSEAHKIKTETSLRELITSVVDQDFGVYITPTFYESRALAMKIMPDESIYKIPEEYRPAFVTATNLFASYIYECFRLDKLLILFRDRPYDEKTMLEIKCLIESYIVMHESTMNKKMTEALVDGIMDSINEKHMI